MSGGHSYDGVSYHKKAAVVVLSCLCCVVLCLNYSAGTLLLQRERRRLAVARHKWETHPVLRLFSLALAVADLAPHFYLFLCQKVVRASDREFPQSAQFCVMMTLEDVLCEEYCDIAWSAAPVNRTDCFHAHADIDGLLLLVWPDHIRFIDLLICCL